MHLRLSSLAAAAILLAAPAFAHHSNAMFDFDKTIELTGTVKQFQWTNPHSWVRLMVTDKGGKSVEYAFELTSPSGLAARGWKPKTIVPGDKVTVTFYPVRDGGRGGSLRSLKLPSGQIMGEQNSAR